MVGELDARISASMRWRCTCRSCSTCWASSAWCPIVAGDAPAEAVAAVFDALWGGPETLFVVSTDLSHYLDYAACQQFDAATAEAIERFESRHHADAGLRSGADARAAAGGAAAGDDDRAARPAQLRRHGRPARPRGGLRRLGAVRGTTAGRGDG